MQRARAIAAVITLLAAVGCSSDGSESSSTARSDGSEVSTATPGDGTGPGGTASAVTVPAGTGTPGTEATTAPAGSDEWVADAMLLPPAGPDAAADPDANAAGLAAIVQQGGSAGLTALLRALEAAGVGVSEGAEIVRPPTAPSQGLLVPAGDVLAMAALFPDPNVVVLDTLVRNVGTVAGLPMTDETAAAAADALLTDLRTLAAGTDPGPRFLVRFLAALTSPASTPDLLGAPDGRGVVLTGPQAMLVLARASADLLVHEGGTGVSGFAGTSGFRAAAPTPRLANQPCSFDNAILDTGTTGLNMALSTFLDYLERLGLDTGAFGGAMNVAGLLASLGKLLATAALFDAQLELLDAPLIRVMGPGRPGQQRELQATVEFEASDAVWVNCLAPMLQIFNGDAGVPLPGPVKNGRVMWSGTTGFATGTGTGYVEFYTLGGAAPAGPQGGLATTTDESGRTRMGIEGTAPADLLPTWAPEYPRPFTVNAALDTRETDVYRNILSAFSQLTNPVIQPIVESAIRGLVGMGVISRSATFEIVDHAPDVDVSMQVGQFMLDGGLCRGDGTVTMSGTDTSSGAAVTMDGELVFDTDETGAGTFTFTTTMALAPGQMPVDATIEMSGGGDVRITAGEDLAVTIEVSNVTASGSGAATGPAGSVNIGLPAKEGGGSALTGTAGLFCE